jgi:hypothetical protein
MITIMEKKEIEIFERNHFTSGLLHRWQTQSQEHMQGVELPPVGHSLPFSSLCT